MHIHAYRAGAILTILGPFTYFVSGTSSFSAFIPSIFGIIFLIIAKLASNEKIRPHAMHVGLLVALAGVLGLALVYFLTAGIQSFRSARKEA